ncbi:MAG: alpha-1,4-glucan--maltose-1-phosphate maltosyltransferase [Bacteroidota bacterium]
MPRLTLPRSWSRVVICWVEPHVDGGAWPVKRTVGEQLDAVAGVIVDGHDTLSVELRYRHEKGPVQAVPLRLRYNNEYEGGFPIEHLGTYTYTVQAWVDQFGTWQDAFQRRVKGGDTAYEIESELKDGALLLRRAAEQAEGDDQAQLLAAADRFDAGDVEAGLDPVVAQLAHQYDPRIGAVESEPLEVVVDPERARFAAWYEFFPRSTAPVPGQHGTLDDAARLLPRIKEMGYDIVYLPPIHPIGEAFRKGKDNRPTAEPGEPGSPWAIGGDRGDGTRGGHKAVHPELGGPEAFDRFVAAATEQGLQVALDIAFQTSPDHPYIADHPDWFKQRPDGTIRYAENPPKKYQDVHPIDFESGDWKALWKELRSVFEHWIDRGVTVFRVDNPHTKPLAFWAWCLGTLRAKHPELIFLSEAFTKPKMMQTLAKLGFNNSYTYFAWRNTKEELTSYGQELFGTDVAEFFRPNFWPNTPDILTEYLAKGGRPAHQVRFVLAATMSSAYGIYGPPYEHVDNTQHPDREEYANNEKYEIRRWNWSDPSSLQGFMQRVNQIRKANPALHHMRNLTFHEVSNPQLIAYSKSWGDNHIVVVVNLDPQHRQSGWLALPMPEGASFRVHDLLNNETYTWHGSHNYVELDPYTKPAHLFRLEFG